MINREIPLTNILLESLSTEQRDRVMKLCTTVELDFGSVLYELNEPYQYVYFPLTCFVSLNVAMTANPPLEIGLIGNEGMLGFNLLLGIDNAPLQAIVEGTGTAMRIPVAQFKQEILRNSELVIIINRYIYVLMQQFSQAAYCIHFHEIEARLARWLLMTDDRASGETFHITHEFLANILGVRRSGVSIAASALRKKSIISYTRGYIRILNRQELEAVSCPCYKTIKKFYSGQLF